MARKNPSYFHKNQSLKEQYCSICPELGAMNKSRRFAGGTGAIFKD